MSESVMATYWRERSEIVEKSFTTCYRELLATRAVLMKIADQYKLDKNIVDERIMEEEKNITL